MRRVLGFLLVVTFALRSLLPAGFMLQAVASAGGEPSALQIVICTGHGAELVTLDANGKPVKSKTGSADAKICSYSGVGSKIAADAAPEPLAAIVVFASVDYVLAVELFRASSRPGELWARGPPTTLS
ncbi:MAG: hypothetical protein WC807_04255 [Hyphomicrobium sp.]|jgi:hypothetical protein